MRFCSALALWMCSMRTRCRRTAGSVRNPKLGVGEIDGPCSVRRDGLHKHGHGVSFQLFGSDLVPWQHTLKTLPWRSA